MSFTRPTGHPSRSSAADSQPAAAELPREDVPVIDLEVDEGPAELLAEQEDDQSTAETNDEPEGESKPEE